MPLGTSGAAPDKTAGLVARADLTESGLDENPLRGNICDLGLGTHLNDTRLP